MSGGYNHPWQWWPNAIPEVTLRDLSPPVEEVVSDDGSDATQDGVQVPAQVTMEAAPVHPEPLMAEAGAALELEWNEIGRAVFDEEPQEAMLLSTWYATSDEESDDEPFVTGHNDFSVRRLRSAYSAMILYGGALDMEVVNSGAQSPVNEEKLIYMDYCCEPLQSEGWHWWKTKYPDWLEAGVYNDFLHYDQDEWLEDKEL
eukprot:1062616-Amphidinium_carterae.1